MKYASPVARLIWMLIMHYISYNIKIVVVFRTEAIFGADTFPAWMSYPLVGQESRLLHRR